MSLVKNKFGLSAEHETAYLSAIMVSQLSEVISERLRVIQRLEGELDEAVGRLCCIPDDDDYANYHYIGMTDTDWLAFMGIHAGRLGIPVVAEIAGYQFDLYN